MSKKRNKGQDKKPDFLADLNAGILDDLTERGRISDAAGCNAALYSRRKKHFIFDSINTITAPSFR